MIEFLKPLFTYLKERTLSKKVMDVILVLTVVSWTSFSYIVAANFDEIKTLINVWEKHDNIKSLINMNEDINREMLTILYGVNADRVILMRLHNGVSDLQGGQFLFATATNETDKPGIEKISPLRKDILVSMLTDWMQDFMKRKCVYIEVKQGNPYYEFFRQTNDNFVIQCPVFDINDSLTGFISVEYTNFTINVNDKANIEKIIQINASKIGAILSGAVLANMER